MEYLFSIIIIITVTPSYLYAINRTYVLSYTTDSEVNLLLGSNGSILTSGTYVNRLLTSSANLLNSTQALLAASDVQSIVFTWNTGDCSYPSASAVTNPTKYISSPICFSQTSSLNNLLQLTATSAQLGQAAIVFMNQYSLHYFSMILSDSNVFYSNLAEQFSSYLTQKSYIFERSISVSNFTSASSISSLTSRGKSIPLKYVLSKLKNSLFLVFFIICSYGEEVSLYGTISSSYPSITSSMGNVIFIFIRWSHHFASFYTTQFAPNISYAVSLPIFHLLPMDGSTTSSLSNVILNYQQIMSSTSNITFSDDVSLDCRHSINYFDLFKVIFILSELEGVQLFQLTLTSNLTSTNWTTLLGPITFDSNQQRSFMYSFIGRSCNGNWAILKSVLSTLTYIDTGLGTCISYPSGDIIITADNGE
jgi:hypothetical protein